MAPASPLLVPVQLQALMVNARVRAQDFRRWGMDYAALAAHTSPEPAAFSGDDPDWAADPANDGIHLHWTLPMALRHGTHDPVAGTTTYPRVPNRWLVVRTSGPGRPDPAAGRPAAAWVVESDYVGPDGTSPFLDPAATTPKPVLIGRALPLARWAERAAGPLFLTAVGPGNVAFASYQPYVADVFSFHDPLEKIEEGDLLSYLVVGWYSDPAADVLATAASGGQAAYFAERLANLGWTVEGRQTATTSIYHGMVRGLTWSSTATGTRPSNTRLAVGNTSIDALTALIRQQAAEQHRTMLDPGLLEAFQYDLLRVLDQPDGPDRLETEIHDAWFSSRPGGSVWQVVASPPADAAQAAAQEAAITDGGAIEEPPWLAGLNRTQLAHDTALRELAGLQRELYETWWKRTNAAHLPTYPEGLTDDQFAVALDPARPGGIAARVVAKTAEVATARATIPWGATQQEFAAAVTAFTTVNPLAPGTELKRSDLQPFRVAADPVVVIAGTRSDAFTDELGVTADGLLPCRFVDQVVTGLTIATAPTPHEVPVVATVTAATLTGRIPSVDLTAVPVVPGELLTEFLLLDPANAAIVTSLGLGTVDPATVARTAAAMTDGADVAGTPPAILPPPWTQPWAPLFLEWEVVYYPIAHTRTPTANWAFDGTGYTWTGAGADTADPISLSGRSILTPQPGFTVKSRLHTYLAANPDVALSDVESFIADIDGWDLLSQALSGFNALLTRRDPASLPAPDATTVVLPPSTTMAALIGPGAAAMPLAGGTHTEFGEWPASGFQALRAGQFTFRRVVVVDRFGQTVDVVNAENEAFFRPVPAEGLSPRGVYVLPEETDRFVQLPPRLLQPARLTAGLVSAVDDRVPLSLDGSTDPVCAWILPNHLDGCLTCYDPGGAALGDVELTAGVTGPQVTWLPVPGGAYPSAASLAPAFPHLAEFIQGIIAAGPAAFADLLTTIDATLWSIDPLGTGDEAYLSVLVGRPLALVRVALRCELEGPPPTDPSWPYTFAPQQAEVLGHSFPVRLGDARLAGDGLIGYLLGSDGSRFFAAHRPAEVTSPYVVAIGPQTYPLFGLGAADPTYLTLLMDPQAPVHVFTDVLPMTTVRVPARFVSAALGSMAVSIRCGPALTDFLEPAVGGTPDVVLARPAELNGTWSWVERGDSGTVTPYGIAPADGAARFPGTAATIRTGWLRLSGALGPHTAEVRSGLRPPATPGMYVAPFGPARDRLDENGPDNDGPDDAGSENNGPVDNGPSPDGQNGSVTP